MRESYEQEQKRLYSLYQELLSDEEIDAGDPFADCDSSEEYVLSDSDLSDESHSASRNIPAKRGRFEKLKKGEEIAEATETAGPSGISRSPTLITDDQGGPRNLQNEESLVQETIESVIATFAIDSDSSEAEDNQDSTNLTWNIVDGSNLQQFVFDVQDVGLKAEFFDFYLKDPYDFYKLFVTDEIITHIVDQTNIYANQKLNQKTPSQKSKSKPWTPTNNEEIETFFGIIIWMGLLKTPQLRDYWSQNFLYQTNVKKKMTRNRFEQLLSMLHFNNNETSSHQDQEFDRLHKITPLVQKLLARFQHIMTPGRNICIDETMVPFRGRLKFKQYIKNKRHKFGIKLYKLCLENGYTYNLKIYCGKDTQPGGNASSNVVMSLMNNLFDAGRTLYTDNYYTSVTLAHELLKRQTHLVGTVRTNRKMNCTEVTKKKIKKNEVFARESNTGVVMMKWFDKRDVLMLSTKHTDETKIVRQRGKDIEKPSIIIDYNESKAFIDLSDQMKAYSHCLRRGNKWYRKLATELLFGCAMVNAFIVYREVTQANISITEFKKLTALKLLGEFPNINRINSNEDDNGHKLIEAKKNRCVVCYAKMKEALGRRAAQNKCSRPKYQCDICKKNYCVSCFFEHHKSVRIM